MFSHKILRIGLLVGLTVAMLAATWSWSNPTWGEDARPAQRFPAPSARGTIPPTAPETDTPTAPATGDATLDATLMKTAALRAALTVPNIRTHLEQLQTTADQHADNRAAGTSGYASAVEYITDQLSAAGYDVVVQPFTFEGFVQVSPPQLHVVEPETTFSEVRDIGLIQFSGSGHITATVQAVDTLSPYGTQPNTSTSGCEADDFADFDAGNIALVQRGTCPFRVKTTNAIEAGAVGVIVYNEGQTGRRDLFGGTLGDALDAEIPVFSASYAAGRRLLRSLEMDRTVTVHMTVETQHGDIETYNVLAETPGGDPNHVVMAGGHFDSVANGPGINDNGSGVATLLEMALQMAELDIEPVNKVRFAFWGAEELGLLGSTYYVQDLAENVPEELDTIALYLNFDMIGSPNYIRAVYRLPGGANGNAAIEQVFTDYFDAYDLHWETTSIAGRSDHAAFLRRGIPVGGLFSGAEGAMSQRQAQGYPHARVGEPHDPCYHGACDTMHNLSDAALDELGDTAAHAVLTFALDSELPLR